MSDTYFQNQALIAKARGDNPRTPDRCDTFEDFPDRITKESDLTRYIEANDFTDDVIEDIQEMFYDQGYYDI